MASSNNGVPKNQTVPKNIMEKVNTYEDEIDLIDYFKVLWKWKYFIVLSAALPALIVFLVFTILPDNYSTTYTYDSWFDKEPPKLFSHKTESITDLSEPQDQVKKDLFDKNKTILLKKFYSKENLDKLAARLEEDGFDEYAEKISKSRIQFEITQTLLTLTITGSTKKDIRKISSIVRDDFENVIPIYTLREVLRNTIAEYKIEMAYIKESSFNLELELERKRAILKKLKNLEPTNPDKIPGSIILQIDDINKNSEYLPLAYQIQATDANIINIEETVKANQKKYNYYDSLVSLNEKLLDETNNKISSFFTIQELNSFLVNIKGDYTEKGLTDYLNAYSKRIENIISINKPVIEMPGINTVPKGAVKKSIVTFAVLLMIASFIAFILEAAQQRQNTTS